MDLVIKNKDESVSKSDIELVQKEKMEYNLLGTFAIGKGYKLFSYSSITQKIEEVEIKKGEFIQCELTTNGWMWFDPENYKTTIDSKKEYFQALNLRLANERVNKFKDGKIKELFNLKKYNPEGINFFKKL